MVTCRLRALYCPGKRQCLRCELQTEFVEGCTIYISVFKKGGLTCKLSKLQLRDSHYKGINKKINSFVNSRNNNKNYDNYFCLQIFHTSFHFLHFEELNFVGEGGTNTFYRLGCKTCLNLAMCILQPLPPTPPPSLPPTPPATTTTTKKTKMFLFRYQHILPLFFFLPFSIFVFIPSRYSLRLSPSYTGNMM